MINWTGPITVPGLVAGVILGALVSTWFRYYITRPKLVVVGGGGGGGAGPGFHVNHISVRNPPGIFGLKLRETIILGWRLHPSVEWGLVLERTPAHECRASLYDKETNKFVKQLYWRTSEGKFVDVVTISSGHSEQLYLFARKADEKLKYFVFQPDPAAASAHSAKEPSPEEKFDQTHHFIVEIRHTYGKKKFRTEASVERGFDGRLSYRHAGGGGSF